MIFLSCHHLLCEIRNRQMHEVGVLWDYNVGSGGKTKVASSIAAPLLFHRWEQNCLGQQLWWQLLMLLQSTLKFNRAEPQPRQLPVIQIFRAKHHCNGLILSALFRSWKKKESKFVATDTMTTQTTRTSSLCTIVSQNPIPFLWKKKSTPPPPPLLVSDSLYPAQAAATAEISCQFLACFLAHSADKYSLDWQIPTLCIPFVTKLNNWLR